ncbi:HDOD domain-containing protein [Marinospirillum alkaliphilum]|uniref:HD-like signal output (HDOD) domain, no enzymatic activity n=1 Tax=Marinospirillum alkaliphilum DSM 21637 TaxID=1122209 RepID=A0A1K1X965_9GAMM|nr:HDOD domain-containing protein [Marinospirillum alkaliphilum]SFX45629.1 HD-like signal output (HDOD) domain, no enzymatic activity [Marinospirillum alkaliphilum DSM 21637]
MKLKDLRQFEQFSQLTDEQLILLKPQLKSRRCQQAGEQIMPLGFASDVEFFLLEGSLLLRAEDGKQKEIRAGSPEARLSIARLRPSMYEVVSASPALLVVISGSLLSEAVQTSGQTFAVSSHTSSLAKSFYQRLQAAVADRSFQLPSLPSVALKVREILQQEEPEIRDLENIISKDPSITAKLVAAANSPMYHRGINCKTCGEAIKRLGLDTTSQLVMLFSLRQLFKANHPWVKQRMIRTWSQGVRVAAITQLLTLHHAHLSADQALLIGLIHNLGELAILKYIDQEKEFDENKMDGLLEELMTDAGVLLLSSWNFDPEVINIIRQQNDWQAEASEEKVGLGDLLKVGRLHSMIGTPDQYRFPRLDEVPAFRKLADQGLTPEFSLTLIEDAADQVAEVQAMFGI